MLVQYERYLVIMKSFILIFIFEMFDKAELLSAIIFIDTALHVFVSLRHDREISLLHRLITSITEWPACFLTRVNHVC